MKLETQKAFARRLGKNPAHVTRLKQAGRLVMRGGKVDVDASLARIEATTNPPPPHLASRDRLEAWELEDLAAEGESPESVEGINQELRAEALRLQKAKADLAWMEVEKAARGLVERSEVESVLSDIRSVAHACLTRLPARLAPMLASHAGDLNAIHAELESAMTEALNEMADSLESRYVP